MKQGHLKILFLCTQPAGYLVNCITTLSRKFDAYVRVVEWPISSAAPFEVDTSEVEVLNKKQVSTKTLYDFTIGFSPDLVFVAGWVDKDYLDIASRLRAQGTISVCGLDNPWKGKWRQWALSLLSPVKVKPYFDKFWVAGQQQRQFAHQLGYTDDNIIDTLYVADLDRFLQKDKKRYTKTLVFAGRLELTKGVDLLHQAFTNLSEEARNGWTLHIIGNGSLADSLKSHPFVRRDGFMQPDALFDSTKDAGGFILPSRSEHWGVVVQEFAAAGLPLLLSDEVHAGEAFLEEGKNGFYFRSGNIDSLQEVMTDFFALSEQQLAAMGKHSTMLALRSTPSVWAQKLLSILPVGKRTNS